MKLVKKTIFPLNLLKGRLCFHEAVTLKQKQKHSPASEPTKIHK